MRLHPLPKRRILARIIGNSSKKLPITLAVIFVSLDILLFQIRAVYSCLINSPLCSESHMAGYVLHFPTSYLIGEALSAVETIFGNHVFTGQDEYWLLLAGVMQAFILGYLLGLLIRFIKGKF